MSLRIPTDCGSTCSKSAKEGREGSGNRLERRSLGQEDTQGTGLQDLGLQTRKHEGRVRTEKNTEDTDRQFDPSSDYLLRIDPHFTTYYKLSR